MLAFQFPLLYHDLAGTTKNSSSPLHMTRTHLLDSEASTEKTENKLAKAWSFPTANEQEAVHKE
jgi:hypothetical protein